MKALVVFGLKISILCLCTHLVQVEFQDGSLFVTLFYDLT